MRPDEVMQNQPAKGVRLILEYEGDAVRLISQQPVEMVIPAADVSTVDRAGQLAHFVDLRDSANKTLARGWRRQNAFASSAEVFPERSGERITRADIPIPLIPGCSIISRFPNIPQVFDGG